MVAGFRAARNKTLTRGEREVNQLIAARRTVREHAFVHLKH
ncbi:hypothetical protein EES46_14680 [Streptomyces sp. ADI98-10]|nr:hypothetical protein EES46_14680 [Streptomyces sp. ADI98-10]